MKYLLYICLSILPPTASAVVLQDLQGHDIPMTGKWVLLNYWADWCQACLDEIPMLNDFYHSHKSVAVLAVNYDRLPLAQQRKLIKRLDIHYPSLADDPASTLGLEEIRALPVTFVFNPEGKWVKTLYGEQTAKTLHQIVQ